MVLISAHPETLVIPAQAGSIDLKTAKNLDSRLRGNDVLPSARTAMSYIGLLGKLKQKDKAIEVAEQTLASIDKNSKDANFIEMLNQTLAHLKTQQ